MIHLLPLKSDSLPLAGRIIPPADRAAKAKGRRAEVTETARGVVC